MVHPGNADPKLLPIGDDPATRPHAGGRNIHGILSVAGLAPREEGEADRRVLDPGAAEEGS